MKKNILVLSVLSLSLTLSGCSSFFGAAGEQKKAEIAEYNSTVKATLDAYTAAHKYAMDNKEPLLNLLIADTPMKGVETKFTPLSDEQKKVFARPAVVSDDYFTSYGSTSAVEVVVLNGGNYRMYATVVWGKDSVISLDRQVKNLYD